MRYYFHPDAEKELNGAVDYYNDCQPLLGLDFLGEIHNAIQIILKYPNAWTSLSRNTRRCIINRFPYGIVYQVTNDGIYVIAIMHLNRMPGYWQGRTDERT